MRGNNTIPLIFDKTLKYLTILLILLAMISLALNIIDSINYRIITDCFFGLVVSGSFTIAYVLVFVQIKLYYNENYKIIKHSNNNDSFLMNKDRLKESKW